MCLEYSYCCHRDRWIEGGISPTKEKEQALQYLVMRCKQIIRVDCILMMILITLRTSTFSKDIDAHSGL